MAMKGVKAKGLEAVCLCETLTFACHKTRILSTNQPATRRHSHGYMKEAETEEQRMKDGGGVLLLGTDNSSLEDESIRRASKRSRREPKEEIRAVGKMTPLFKLWEPKAS